MLAIRLQRIGKAKHPTYRLIVNEKAQDTQGHVLELLGTFNPHLKENQFQPKVERVKYWLEKGAKPSATIFNLLVKAGLATGAKQKSVYLSGKRKTKIAEKKSAQGGSASGGKAPEQPAVSAPAPTPAPEAPAAA